MSKAIPNEAIPVIKGAIEEKQDTLISGTNIKTINGTSILGAGDLAVNADLSNYYTKSETNTQISSSVSNARSIVPTVVPTSSNGILTVPSNTKIGTTVTEGLTFNIVLSADVSISSGVQIKLSSTGTSYYIYLFSVVPEYYDAWYQDKIKIGLLKANKLYSLVYSTEIGGFVCTNSFSSLSANQLSGYNTPSSISSSTLVSSHVIAPNYTNIIRLGNRKIMWGNILQTWTKTTATNVTITLPESMQNNQYHVTFSMYSNTTDVSGIENLNPALNRSSRTTSSFQIRVYNDRSNDISNIGLNWLAIG